MSALGGALGAASLPAIAAAQERQWKHGLSLFGEPRYPAGFKHFDYVNPAAPKGGTVRQVAFGTFDNFNQVVAGVKGSLAMGTDLFTEALTSPALDEVSTEYGLLAEAVSYPDDRSSVTYRLRANALWHDGKPVTPEDVVFSFDTFKQNSPQLGAYYRHVTKAEKSGEREVTFIFDGPGNRELPQIVGQLPVLPKHWWEGTDKSGKKRDVTQTTLEPPLGSGPYRVKEFAPGRSIVYERVADYWGKDLNLNIGTNNFQQIRYEYYRDSTVALEAFKGDQVDWRTENSAKNWATAYDFPAVRDKKVVLEEFPIRNVGVMQAFAFNIQARQVQGPARAPRVQFRVRFRGDEQADFLRPVQTHCQLFRGHRTGFIGNSARQGTGDPAKREGQGAGRPVHQALHQSGRRQSAGQPRQSARGARAVSRSRVRDQGYQAHQREDRRTLQRRVPGRGPGHRAFRAVLQALAATRRHDGQRARGR